MAEKHMNSSSLTQPNKTLLINRLNQLLIKTPDHPPYSAMIQKAIVELSEKRDSSEESISKFLEKEYKDLPVAHLTFLKHHLAKLCKSGDIALTRGKKYVIAGVNLSLETPVKGKVSQVKEIVKCDSERQQRKSTKQLVQQRKLSLKATVKINKRPVKKMFKWDYENKQRQLKKLLAQQGNQRKNDKVKLTEKHSEPHSVQENRSVEKEAKESSQELVMAGPKKRSKRHKGHGLLSEALRRSKRLQNDFKPEENEVEKKLDLIVEPVLAEVLSDKCIQMHDPRNIRVKATVRSNKLPVKSIYKWDWERKQRQLKKRQAQKSIQIKNDESKVTGKHSEPNDVQENGSAQEETKEFSQELVLVGPVKRTHLKRIKGTGLLPETSRRSKRLQNDFKKDAEVERKTDLLIEPESLSERKCIQTQSRRSTRLAEKKQEIKFSSELERPQGQKVDPDLSRITKLQRKVPENCDKNVEPDSSQVTELREPVNQMSENQEDVAVMKCEGIKTYRRRSKADIQARLIVKDNKKEVESEVSKSQASSLCMDINDDQSQENVEDDRLITWIRRKRLRSRQLISDSKVFKETDEQAADGSCSALVVTTHETLETIDSVSNGAEKLPEKRPEIIKRLGRPPKRPRICIIALMANNSGKTRN